MILALQQQCSFPVSQVERSQRMHVQITPVCRSQRRYIKRMRIERKAFYGSVERIWKQSGNATHRVEQLLATHEGFIQKTQRALRLVSRHLGLSDIGPIRAVLSQDDFVNKLTELLKRRGCNAHQATVILCRVEKALDVLIHKLRTETCKAELQFQHGTRKKRCPICSE